MAVAAVDSFLELVLTCELERRAEVDDVACFVVLDKTFEDAEDDLMAVEVEVEVEAEDEDPPLTFFTAEDSKYV